MAKSAPPKKKKDPTRKGIDVKFDLGPLKATEGQIETLKTLLRNQVLTWLTVDVKEKGEVPVTVGGEIPRPPKPPEGAD